MLKKLGYEPVSASGGQEALAALEQERFDLVFMDMLMPGMDGREATRRIIDRWPEGERPRIVAMTAEVLQGRPRRMSGRRDGRLRAQAGAGGRHREGPGAFARGFRGSPNSGGCSLTPADRAAATKVGTPLRGVHKSPKCVRHRDRCMGVSRKGCSLLLTRFLDAREAVFGKIEGFCSALPSNSCLLPIQIILLFLLCVSIQIILCVSALSFCSPAPDDSDRRLVPIRITKQIAVAHGAP